MHLDRFSFYINSLKKLFKFYLLGLILLTIFRFVFLVKFGDGDLYENYFIDILQAFYVGLKFDTMVLAYVLSPIYLFSCLSFLLGYSLFNRAFNLLSKMFVFIGLLIVMSFSMVDYFFYTFFQSRINVLFFGIFDDDTKAVLDSVWADYPVFSIVFIYILFFYIVNKFSNRFIKSDLKHSIKVSWHVKVITFLVVAGLFVLAMRGSVGVFPLQNDDTTISDNLVVNSLTYNGVYAFKNALKEKKKQRIDLDISKSLHRYGYKTAEQSVKDYLNKDFVEGVDPLEQLHVKTPENNFLEENPPNVVFFLMESLGNHYLTFQSPEFDVLGKLGKELPHCYHYRNFVSCTGGTIHSLEGLMVNTPKTPIAQSSFLNRNLKSSVAYPFSKAGYNTTFVSGGKLGWRNLDKFVPNQYFKNVYGKSKILKSIEGSTQNGWGVYDQYLFDFIYSDLNKNKKKPNFYFVLSTTNHTPFVLPDDYKPNNLNIPESVLKQSTVSDDITRKNFTAYRYSNDYLGDFINKVRSSPLGKNTIIVVTGDHNCRQLFNYQDKDSFLKMSVPLIVYVPEQYKSKNSVNQDVFASHKDIFPTIFNLALSDAKYVKSGNDLMNYDVNNNYFGIYNYSVAFNQKGCVFLDTQLSYEWKNKSHFLAPNDFNTSPDLQLLHRTANAFTASMGYNIQMDIKSSGKN